MITQINENNLLYIRYGKCVSGIVFNRIYNGINRMTDIFNMGGFNFKVNEIIKRKNTK